MAEEWNEKTRENLNSDSTEKHNQEENNNGNIGREASAADFNAADQVPGERGQFGTTAEHGSGSLKDRIKEDRSQLDLEGYQAGNISTQSGPTDQTTRDRWNQGTEGSPGQGYSDDYTSGRRQQNKPSRDSGVFETPENHGTAGNIHGEAESTMGPGGSSGASGENYGTAGNSAESQGVSGMHRTSGENYSNQSSTSPIHNQGNTQIEGNPELNKPTEKDKPRFTSNEDDIDEDDDPRNQLL